MALFGGSTFLEVQQFESGPALEWACSRVRHDCRPWAWLPISNILGMNSIKAQRFNVSAHGVASRVIRPLRVLSQPRFRPIQSANVQEQDLESAVELFMRRQAELESGGKKNPAILHVLHLTLLLSTSCLCTDCKGS